MLYRSASQQNCSGSTCGASAAVNVAATDAAVVASLEATGFPAAEAAAVLADVGGDIDVAAQRLFSSWTGEVPHGKHFRKAAIMDCRQFRPRTSAKV